MSYFNCRLLLRSRYEAAVRDLERAAMGDVAALASIRARCRDWLQSEAFQKWHAGDTGRYTRTEWLKRVEGPSDDASPQAAQAIAEVFIAATCMPEFQAGYWCSQTEVIPPSEVSPNLVPLSDYDGGLFGVLASVNGADFDDFFFGRHFERWAHPEKYGVGSAMFIFDHADLARFRELIAQATDAKCRISYLFFVEPKACIDSRERLAALVERCLSHEDGLLAVEDVE
jgi:hypothetical protein